MLTRLLTAISRLLELFFGFRRGLSFIMLTTFIRSVILIAPSFEGLDMNVSSIDLSKTFLRSTWMVGEFSGSIFAPPLIIQSFFLCLGVIFLGRVFEILIFTILDLSFWESRCFIKFPVKNEPLVTAMWLMS